MRQIFSIAVAIAICNSIQAQTTTTYYDQYGMPIGTAKTEKAWAQQPWEPKPYEYRSTIPFDLINRAMATKQAEFDKRKGAIQTMIDGIGADIDRLFADRPEESNRLYKGLNDLITRLNTVQQDITEDQVYNPIIDAVRDFKNKVYRTYNGLKSAPRTTGEKPLPKWADVKALLDDKKYSEAIDALNTLANAVSDNEPYIEYRAWIYGYRIRNFEKAIQDYTTCIQMRPDSTKLYYHRGVISEYNNQYVEAIKDFTTCIQRNPVNLDACFVRAHCKSYMGDYRGEVSDYDYIISKLEENEQLKHNFLVATVYNNKGYALFKMGNTDEALMWVNRALRTGGSSESYIWSSRGEIYLKQSKYSEAISDLDKSIELFETKQSKFLPFSGNDGMEYYLRGLAKIKMGSKDAGCNDLSKAGEQGYEDAYRTIQEKCK